MTNKHTIHDMKREYQQPEAEVVICEDSILSLSLTTSDSPADSQPAGAKSNQLFDYMGFDEFDASDE